MAQSPATPPREIRLLGASVFGPGEELRYRVHYGFINAGEAVLTVDRRVREQAERPCYQVEVSGRTTGAFSRFMKIRNVWGTYLDTAQMKPLRAYRNIRENRYRLDEDLQFDYNRRLVSVKRTERKDTAYRIPNPVFDIVSGYYFLRQVDYSQLAPGTVMSLDAYFDDAQYKFKVRFVGREAVKTKFGRVSALVLSPIMPENSFFDGENAIRLWMSDDANRVPLKVSAELLVGSVDLDLEDYRGTRRPLAVFKD